MVRPASRGQRNRGGASASLAARVILRALGLHVLFGRFLPSLILFTVLLLPFVLGWTKVVLASLWTSKPSCSGECMMGMHVNPPPSPSLPFRHHQKL